MNKRTAKKFKIAAAIATMLIALACVLIYVADASPEFTASAATSAGESISLKVVPVFSRPSAWLLAWRVGTTQVSTVNIGIQVLPEGSNVINPRLTYYVKAASGSQNKQVLRGSDVAVALGSTFSNSTGSISINTHLSDLGLSTSQDQTVQYYVYTRLEATGAVSGQTLVAEVQEQLFSSITYDYGGVTTQTVTKIAVANVYVRDYSGGGYTDFVQVTYAYYQYAGRYITENAYIKFDASDMSGNITSATLQLTLKDYGYTGTIGIYRTTSNDWTETMYWATQPGIDTSKVVVVSGTSSINADVKSLCPSTAPAIISFSLRPYTTPVASVYYARNTPSYAPKLVLTVQSINWNLSWQWANQPLSLIAVPVARLLVAAALALFAIMLFYSTAKSKRKNKAALIVGVIVLLFALWIGIGKAHASPAIPMPIPEKWRAGDLAVYLQSFPFPTIEYVNGTPAEKPATIEGDLMLNLAVFNATGDLPVIINMDGRDVDRLESEGFYMLQYSLTPGDHSISIYSPLKIFEQTVFYVKPRPVTPLMPLEEFLKRLEQQRNEIIQRMLFAAVAAIPVGVYVKRKTLKHTAWIYPVPAAFVLAGYVRMPDLYWLLAFGASMAVSYALCPDFTKKHYLLLTLRDKASRLAKIALRSLDVDRQGNAVLEISPRYWRRGFIRKAEVKVENPAVSTVEVDGELCPAYIARDVELRGDVVKIECDPATKLILEAGVETVEAMAKQNAELQSKIFAFEHANAAVVASAMAKVDEQTKSDVERLFSADAFLRKAAPKPGPTAVPSELPAEGSEDERGEVEAEHE